MAQRKLGTSDNEQQLSNHCGPSCCCMKQHADYMVAEITRSVGNILQQQRSKRASDQIFSDVDAPKDNAQIFLSYQWNKREEVTALRKRLEERQPHTAWMDTNCVQNERFFYSTVAGIRNCQVFIPCITSQYIDNYDCRQEVALAIEWKKTMIPLLLEPGVILSGTMGAAFRHMEPINCADVARDKLLLWQCPQFDELMKRIAHTIDMNLVLARKKSLTLCENDFEVECINNFTVPHIRCLPYSDVTSIALLNGKIVLGSQTSPVIATHSATDYKQLSHFNAPGFIIDVVCTTHGDLVYTTSLNPCVIKANISSGKTLIETSMAEPWGLSRATDGTLLLADRQLGIYQSTDDGNSWKLLLKPDTSANDDSWHAWTAIQVSVVQAESKDNYTSIWALQMNGDEMKRLCRHVQSMDGTWTTKEVSMHKPDGTFIDLSLRSRLVFDGKSLVLLNDWKSNVINVFSSAGVHLYELLSPDKIASPWAMALDTRHQLLYVGVLWGKVLVFKLTKKSKLQRD